MANWWGNSRNSDRVYFGAPKSLQMVTAVMKLKDAYSLEGKVMTNLDSTLKSRDIIFQQGLSSQGYGFSSSYVWMWKLDYKESWMPKNWCFWTVVLEKTLESPLDCKEIQPVHPKGNQSNECSLEGQMLKLKLQSLATWCEGLTHLKRPWYWERFKAGGEGDNREWDG